MMVSGYSFHRQSANCMLCLVQYNSRNLRACQNQAWHGQMYWPGNVDKYNTTEL